jgi:mannose-6-phosphate isomerase-like protein (cupin superfamily)
VPLQLRRVVTGHDKNGRAVVLKDEIAPNVASLRPGHATHGIWSADVNAPDLKSDRDGGLDAQGPPRKGQAIFRVIQYEPGVEPRRHKTESIDYAVMMSGEIDMELDDGVVVHLKAGDVLVQRATVHNWVNRGKVPAVIAFVLIHADLEGDKAFG